MFKLTSSVVIETCKDSRGRISSRVLCYIYDLKDQLLTVTKEGIVVNPPELGNLPDQGEVTYASWALWQVWPRMDKPSHPVAIISMGQERQAQTRQGIPLPITARILMILDLIIQDRATSMKVALFFWLWMNRSDGITQS